MNSPAQLVVRIAAQEASLKGAPLITNDHLLLGLLNLRNFAERAGPGALSEAEQELIDREYGSVADVLGDLLVDATRLRRAVRDACPSGGRPGAGGSTEPLPSAGGALGGLLGRLGIDAAKLKDTLFGKAPAADRFANLSQSAARAIEEAEANAPGGRPGLCLHLFRAILREPGPALARALQKLGIDEGALRAAAGGGRGPGAPAPPSAGPAKAQDLMSSYEAQSMAVFFDDIVGSTQLLHKIGDDAFIPLLRRHNRVLAETAARLGQGKVIKSTGDGSLVVFDQPADAVLCALDIQERARSGELGLGLRIGIDFGPAQYYTKGSSTDVFGMTVVKASRITALAQAGHVLVTKVVRDLAAPRLELPWLNWHDHGFFRNRPGEPAVEVAEPFDARCMRPMTALVPSK